MDRFSIFTCVYMVLNWICILLTATNYSQTAVQVSKNSHAEAVVNYAVDAAVDTLVRGTTDLDMDYTDYERIAVGPEACLNKFLDYFCKGMGMSVTEANKSLIKTDYLSAFVVAVYDGFYIAKPTVINDSGAMDLVFSQKKPYIYKDSATGRVYALNLGAKDAKSLEGTFLKKVIPPISKEEQRAVINSVISDALNEVVDEVREGNIHSTFYLPSEATLLTNTNPVDRVTILAYVDGIEVGFGDLAEILGVGGARVTHTRYCVGYMKNGQKTYCYADKKPEDVTAEATFDSPQDAAAAGYYFDIDTLSARD